MFASTALRASVRTPMIHFLGKRSLPTKPRTPAPHPQAPKEIADNFAAFLAKSGRSSSSSAPSTSAIAAAIESLYPKSDKAADFEEFYDAPAYYWTKKEMSEREIEAIMSGGATYILTGA